MIDQLMQVPNNEQKKMAIYTVLMGTYDTLMIPEIIDQDCDYYCVTNLNSLTSEFWKIIYIEDIHQLGNIRLARFIKIHPHLLFAHYEVSLFMDCNILWKKSIWKFMQEYGTGKKLLTMKHTERDCVYDEIRACRVFGKDFPENLRKHLFYLKEENYPRKNGLVESGVMYRFHQNEQVIKTMEAWWTLLEYASRRDQLSFNYACWKEGLAFDIGENIVGEEGKAYFQIMEHKQLSKEIEISIENNIFEVLEIKADDEILIYGAGEKGRVAIEQLKEHLPFIFVTICDKNYKNIKEIEGIPVRSIEECLSNKSEEMKVIITPFEGYDEIFNMMLDYHINEKNIYYLHRSPKVMG